MTTTAPLPTQAFLDGANDKNQPARYELIGGLLKDCQSVLDVGCGDGLLRGFLKERCDYLGIDSDFEAIEKAIAKHQAIWFAYANAETYEPHRIFEAVVLNEVLYYLKDPLAALRKWVAVVKPGGILIVSIYNRPSQFWQSNPNMKALKIARRFAGRNLEQEIPVEQNGKKWSVLVIHC